MLRPRGRRRSLAAVAERKRGFGWIKTSLPDNVANPGLTDRAVLQVPRVDVGES
jgi:hypothetical protein